jgi:hypothetical protein
VEFKDGSFEGGGHYEDRIEAIKQYEQNQTKAKESAERQKSERLKAQAEKLKDLPANSDTMAVVDFIGKYCDLSELSWAEINIYARENGFTVLTIKTGIYCGVNNLPAKAAA